jgi:hypothetical protein
MSAYRIFPSPHLLTEGMYEFLASKAGRDFALLTSFFPAEWKAVVMGGLLRDLLLDRGLKIDTKPSDVDLVIFGANSIDEIRSKLSNTIHSTNAFGGVKCQLHPDGMVFDLWRVEDHTNMALAPKPHTIEQLLRHNLLNIDAILWDPATDCLHDCGCLIAVETGRIGMIGPEGISREFLATQVAHVLVIAFKTNLPLSDEVRSFVTNASAHCRLIDIERTLERKLPQVAAQIEVFWNGLLSGGTQTCPGSTRTVIP